MNEQNPEILKQISRTLSVMGRHKAALEAIEEAQKVSKNDWVSSTPGSIDLFHFGLVRNRSPSTTKDAFW